MFNNTGGAESMQVASFIMQETGTYNPMYTRPYQVDTTSGAMESVVARLEQSVGVMNGSALAGVGSSLMKPSATVRQGVSDIYVPNGWNERRLRFVLEVHVRMRTGSMMLYYFQGFTDHLGVSHGNHIDPNMPFYINSFMRVNRNHVMGTTGMMVQDVVVESGQIINGRMIFQNNQEAFKLRPADVFANIQTNYLASELSGGVTDTRTKTNLGMDNFGNNRINNMPSHFMAKFMQDLKDSTMLTHFGQGSENVLSRSQSVALAREPSPEDNPVLRAFAAIQGVRQTAMFNLNDMTALDPTFQARTTYNQIGTQGYGMLHTTGQTSHWHGADRETLFVTQLINSIPSLMMESFVSNMTLKATNMFGLNNEVCQIIKPMALTGADMRHQLDLLARRIQQEVLYDLSTMNQEPYDIEMRIDLMGETFVRIRMYNASHYDYVAPTFGDGLIAPIYTRDLAAYQQLSSDLELVKNSVQGAFSPAPDQSRIFTGSSHF